MRKIVTREGSLRGEMSRIGSPEGILLGQMIRIASPEGIWSGRMGFGDFFLRVSNKRWKKLNTCSAADWLPDSSG